MTILDDRAGVARLSPTPLSLLREAIDRMEGDLDGLKWDVYDHADADTFSGLDIDKFPVLSKIRNPEVREEVVEHIDDLKKKLQYDLNVAGADLYDAVLKVLRELEAELEVEFIRLLT